MHTHYRAVLYEYVGLKKFFEFPETDRNAFVPILLGLTAIDVLHKRIEISDDSGIFGFFQ